MLSVRSLSKQISNCIRCRDDKQLAQSIWLLEGWRDGEILGQYLLESEKDSELNVEGTISNSKRAVTVYWKLKILYWVCLLCFFSLDEHSTYVLVFKQLNFLCI